MNDADKFRAWPSALDAVENMPPETAAKLEAMSERLEAEITAAVKTILENSGYFRSDSLDKLVMPVAAWACELPYEAHGKGLVITNDRGGLNRR